VNATRAKRIRKRATVVAVAICEAEARMSRVQRLSRFLRRRPHPYLARVARRALGVYVRRLGA